MNEAEKRSNLLGLIMLFIIFTPLGIVLSYFYIFFQANIHYLWLNIIAVIVVGGILAAIVFIIKRIFKITNNIMSVIVVAISLAIIVFVMWNMWFVLMFERFVLERDMHVFSDLGEFVSLTREMIFVDPEFMNFLRLFNEYGTWHINYNTWTGAMLAIVWVAELLGVVVLPLLAAYAAAGLFITELNAWVEERLMNFGFSAFDDYELDRLASGDINVILEKSLETRNGQMNAVAVCYHNDEPTDYIAVYRAHWDKEGALAKGRHIMTVQLGQEKIDTLDAALQAKHFPTPEKKETPIEAPTGDMAAAIFDQYATADTTIEEENVQGNETDATND